MCCLLERPRTGLPMDSSVSLGRSKHALLTPRYSWIEKLRADDWMTLSVMAACSAEWHVC